MCPNACCICSNPEQRLMHSCWNVLRDVAITQICGTTGARRIRIDEPQICKIWLNPGHIRYDMPLFIYPIHAIAGSISRKMLTNLQWLERAHTYTRDTLLVLPKLQPQALWILADHVTHFAKYTHDTLVVIAQSCLQRHDSYLLSAWYGNIQAVVMKSGHSRYTLCQEQLHTTTCQKQPSTHAAWPASLVAFLVSYLCEHCVYDITVFHVIAVGTSIVIQDLASKYKLQILPLHRKACCICLHHFHYGCGLAYFELSLSSILRFHYKLNSGSTL